MTRLGILVNHPAQYFAPAFRQLALATGIELEVNYWQTNHGGTFEPGFNRHVTWSEDLYTGYDWWTPQGSGNFSQRAKQCWQRLARRKPHVMICFGWASPIARIGLAYGAVTHTPVLLYGDTNGRIEKSGWRARVHRTAVDAVMRFAAGAVTTGAANRQFYRAHGMPEIKLHAGVLPIALDSFIRAGDARTQKLGDRKVVGFAGKLQPHKGAADLIRAMAQVGSGAQIELRIIGDGPQRSELEKITSQLGMTATTSFLGFKNSDEIPDALAGMDVFVMPSRFEPRGLVAIEAMATGAAPIVSSASGVWGDHDAVQHGRTGLVFPVGDVGALASAIASLVNDEGRLRRISRNARERSREFGPDDFARSVVSAVALVRHRQG